MYTTGLGLKKKSIPFHPLTNFEIIDFFKIKDLKSGTSKDVNELNGVFLEIIFLN